jgi:hypothetical protein
LSARVENGVRQLPPRGLYQLRGLVDFVVAAAATTGLKRDHVLAFVRERWDALETEERFLRVRAHQEARKRARRRGQR